MRHKLGYKKYDRTSAHRKSLFRNMATSLFLHEKFETTLPKAKGLRPIAEKLIRLAANDTLPARRKAYGYLMNKEVVHKLFTVLGPRYTSRPGGYTRIIRTGYRHGDAAQNAWIALVTEEVSAKKAS